MAEIIDGKKVSTDLKLELKEKVAEYGKQGISICLAVIQVGDDKASSVYVRNKKKACEFIGIKSLSYELPESTTEEELLNLVKELNERDDVNGILVQLPLPPASVGALSIGNKGFISCTPYGIIELLKRYNVEMDGKECVVIGRSNIVGKPMSMLMLRENATVTVAHSHTKYLKEICKRADILIVAIGKPKFIDADYVKEGAVVIDVGIHRNDENKLCGDVDFDSVMPHTSAITPVPGGVGPMTIAMLMKNCVNAVEIQDIKGKTK